MTQLLQQLNLEISDIVDKARQSLVKVDNQQRGAGAGTILHADGLVITNAHVVVAPRRGQFRMGWRYAAQPQAPRVTLWDGRTLKGNILAYDERLDLAALSVPAGDLPSIELRNGGGPYPGEWVVALGHPWGVTGATTAGMIISTSQPVEGLPYDGPLIQVGLHLRPGHSGGPMVDGEGRLIGINTMIAGPDVGLAVPIQTVKGFLKKNLG